MCFFRQYRNENISAALKIQWRFPICLETLCQVDVIEETRPHFYQTRSAWSVDQGSNKNHSPAYNLAPTVTKFCVMWEGLSLPHDTKFGNCRCKILDSRSFPSWSLIHGLRWSGLIKAAAEINLNKPTKHYHHKPLIQRFQHTTQNNVIVTLKRRRDVALMS